MKDEEKTREQLLDELSRMRSRIAELEEIEDEHKRMDVARRESEDRLRSLVLNSRDISEGKRMEEALEKRIMALTQPLDDIENIAFEDLFNLSDLQRLQDLFAGVWGVAALITYPDGTPITRPSNFSCLCSEIIRRNPKGLRNCRLSDAMIGRHNPSGPTIQRCLSAGLSNAGASITVGGRHLANWLIGQVRNEAQSEEQMMAYAREIGADETAFRDAYRKLPTMPQEKFDQIAHALFALAKQLSTTAYQNILQARFIADRKQTEKVLQGERRKLTERLKELNCLYGISHLLERPDTTMEELLEGIVEIIPPSWQYPEIACARITLDGREYRTENFIETPWRQAQDIFVHGERAGAVEVLYREERPDGDEGPFLKEERRVLNAMAERIGQVIGRTRTEEALRKREEEIRKNEAVVRSLLEATPVGVALLVNRVHVKVNPALCRILGFSEEELIGSSTRIVFPDDEEFERVARVGYGQLKREGLAILDARFKRKDGALIDVLVCMSPFDHDDAAAGVAVTVVDITERKRAEEERLQLEQRLHEAEKAESLGRMAGAVAHHFNNLLGAVMGRLELALGDLPQAPRLLKHLTEAMKASQRAADISRLMLTYLGQTVQMKKPCDIVETTRKALGELGPSLLKRVQVTAELPSGAIMIQGDEAHLEQALVNLLLNAGESIGDGDGQITVAVHILTAEKVREFRLFPSDWEPTENSYVAISISDTGAGFDPATMERIFDPFYSTKFPGRGLGLAVVLGIVRAHAGVLTVESQVGQGSIFRLFFPLKDLKAALGMPQKPLPAASRAASQAEQVLPIERKRRFYAPK